MQMIRMLDQFKSKREQLMDDKQLRETLEDLRKEQSDLEYEKEIEGRQVVPTDSEEAPNKKLSVKFIRPPKNSKEAIKTLQETDARFEVNKQFLEGNKGSLKKSESNEDM